MIDVGAGTGRVTLELARAGTAVIAVDIEQRLLDALAKRANDLPITTLTADVRELPPGPAVELIVVPMQTLQLLGGRAGRAAFLAAARPRLRTGGLLAAALADPVDCFDDEHPDPPPPATCEIGGVHYSTQLLGVTPDGTLHRRRTIGTEAYDVATRLDRVTGDEVANQAEAAGYVREPDREIPETERYLGSTVVMLRASSASGDAA